MECEEEKKKKKRLQRRGRSTRSEQSQNEWQPFGGQVKRRTMKTARGEELKQRSGWIGGPQIGTFSSRARTASLLRAYRMIGVGSRTHRAKPGNLSMQTANRCSWSRVIRPQLVAMAHRGPLVSLPRYHVRIIRAVSVADC